eukprot:ctg_2550.g583
MAAGADGTTASSASTSMASSRGGKPERWPFREIVSPQNVKLKEIRELLRSTKASVADALLAAEACTRLRDRSHGDEDSGRVAELERDPHSGAPFVIEGARLVLDALECGWRPKFVLCDARSAGDLHRRHPRLFAHLCDPSISRRVQLCSTPMPSDTTSPQGIVGVFRRQPLPWCSDTSNVMLLLDGVQDPGNMGTILRSGCAAGVQGVLLTPGCADAWSTKALRAGMGAHFRVPIVEDVPWNRVPQVLEMATTGMTRSDGNGALEEGRAAWTEWPFVMAVAHGRAEPDILHRTYTDCAAFADVARTESRSEGGNGSTGRPSGQRRLCLLVIGSEAHGPSEEAFALARQVSGSCTIEIPMMCRTDSLNAAVAASVILFEAQRRRQQALQERADHAVMGASGSPPKRS